MMSPIRSSQEPGKGRRAKFLFLLLFLTVQSLPIAEAQNNLPPLSHESAVWKLKSKQIGYNYSVFRNFGPTVGGDRVKIQFLDDERVALAWLTPYKDQAKPISFSADVPSILHLAIFDSRTGKRLSSHVWKCSSRWVNLAYTAFGQWLLASHDTVALFSPSYEKLRELPNVRTEFSNTFVSQTGCTFLTHTSYSGGKRSTQLRNSSTFEVIDSWDDSQVARSVIAYRYSDRFVLALVIKPRGPQQLYLRRTGRPWSLCTLPIREPQPTGHVGFGFVNEDMVAISAGHELALSTVEGAELLSVTLPKGFDSYSVSATSFGGKRFALILDRMRGLRSEPLDMYPFPSDDRLIVYSVPKQSAIFSIKLKGVSPWLFLASHVGWNRIALSPNGRLLGIVSDEGLRVYTVTPASGE